MPSSPTGSAETTAPSSAAAEMLTRQIKAMHVYCIELNVLEQPGMLIERYEDIQALRRQAPDFFNLISGLLRDALILNLDNLLDRAGERDSHYHHELLTTHDDRWGVIYARPDGGLAVAGFVHHPAEPKWRAETWYPHVERLLSVAKEIFRPGQRPPPALAPGRSLPRQGRVSTMRFMTLALMVSSLPRFRTLPAPPRPLSNFKTTWWRNSRRSNHWTCTGRSRRPNL